MNSSVAEDHLMMNASAGGNLLVDRLKSEEIMNKLSEYMLDQKTPQSSTTLTNGINILIELIRRYCSEIEQAEYQQHQYQVQPAHLRQGPPPPSDEKLQALATDLNDLLRVVGCRLMQFAELLHSSRGSEEQTTTNGQSQPLGSERLKTCELFAEILHLQYLYTSSPLFERLISASTISTKRKPDADSKIEGNSANGTEIAPTHTTSVADELITITDKFIDAKILPACLDLFFSFPWNNFLHSVVYDMIAKVFNTYSYTSSSKPSDSPKPENLAEVKVDTDAERSPEEVQQDEEDVARAAVESQMNSVKIIVRKLVLSIFKQGDLTKRIIKAQSDNDKNVAQPKGVRLGYMGHLTYISDEVCKLIEKCNEDFVQEVGEYISAEDWQEYVAGPLSETKERDRQALGGVRPNAGNQPHNVPLLTGVGGLGMNGPPDDGDLPQSPRGATGDDDDDDDDDLDSVALNGGNGGGDAGGDDQGRNRQGDDLYWQSEEDSWKLLKGVVVAAPPCRRFEKHEEQKEGDRSFVPSFLRDRLSHPTTLHLRTYLKDFTAKMFLTVLAWISISFLLPVLLFGTRLGKPRAVETGEATSTRGKARRNNRSIRGLATVPHPTTTTLHELLQYAVQAHASKRAMGQRKVVRQIVEEKQVERMVDGKAVKDIKKWNFYELSPFQWMTYADVKQHVADIAAGLRAVGLKAEDKLTLFAATSRDWQLIAHASWSQSITITTAYDTLGEEGLSFSLNEGDITTMFTNADLLKMLLKIGSKVPSLKRVIYNGEADVKTIAQIKEAFPAYELYSLDEVVALGQATPVSAVPPKPEDIALIMYTSGSTGNPKGVLLSHSNIVAAVAGAKDLTDTVIAHDEVYLAYLPLAHVLEIVTEQLCICEGVAIGYGSVRTLTDASVRNCKGDIRELGPTIMSGVPAVWETIRKSVESKLKHKSAFANKVFRFACAFKWELLKLGLPTGFLDNTIFKPIRDQTGGRLRFALSGGAPMPQETQKFMTSCVCPVVQGYGMTETCAVTSIQLPQDPWMLGRVGPPTSCVEIMLTAVEDTNYSPFNRPRPQGEIWLRGPSIMKGYYKNPKATAETLTSDGWLMTGDIGEFHPDGTLQVIDRKKNLVKLSNGEYIGECTNALGLFCRKSPTKTDHSTSLIRSALEKLESQYKMSSYVHNLCVYAHSEQGFAVAIVNPVENAVLSLAKEKGIQSRDVEYLCQQDEIRKHILADMKAVAKRADFKPAEILGNVTLHAEIWTPENGLLTAAQKLKRKEIVEAHQHNIDAMYKTGKQ
ncbi:long-chain fatty acid-CoA ligase [Thoreauomyces humboldtii]|nr:long-chain fatty acid-CoA ligase [Thoreauomyces humboldtii]